MSKDVCVYMFVYEVREMCCVYMLFVFVYLLGHTVRGRRNHCTSLMPQATFPAWTHSDASMEPGPHQRHHGRLILKEK